MTHDRVGIGDGQDYVAYLLRLWREKGCKNTQWRASLQDPHSGERVGFTNLEELFVYLQRKTGDLLVKDGETHDDEMDDQRE